MHIYIYIEVQYGCGGGGWSVRAGGGVKINSFDSTYAIRDSRAASLQPTAVKKFQPSVPQSYNITSRI